MNINRLTKIGVAALVVVIGLSGFNVNTAKAAIINLDALDASGVTLNLTAGNYTATPIGVADGGLFNAFNGIAPGVVNGCDIDGKNCADGWSTHFRITSASLGTLIFNPPPNFADEFIALANAVPGIFSLSTTEAVTFAVVDNPADFGDNIGGVSLHVAAVPLPAALPLFLSALAGLGLMGWRRRQAGG